MSESYKPHHFHINASKIPGIVQAEYAFDFMSRCIHNGDEVGNMGYVYTFSSYSYMNYYVMKIND